MNSLTDFFQQNFNTQRDQWEKSLRSELKIEDVSSKSTKRSAEGAWPVLSLESRNAHQLKPREAWKKAAQTYVRMPKDLEAALRDDLEGGVRLFFFEKDFLTNSDWNKVSALLNSHTDHLDIVVILLGDRKISETTVRFTLVDEASMILGRGVAAPGGNNIQELASLAHTLTQELPEKEIWLGIFLDSHFFKNIAKVRAARLLAARILEEYGVKRNVIVVGLTSLRDWTLYERYSNTLRNNASVASGYIAGCDYVQSSGYQTLFELETELSDPEHEERSRRMARNSSHILSLESMLGIVEDASYGSYHLENLTEEYASEAWKIMQKLHSMDPHEVAEFFQKETTPVRETRLKNLSTRRHVLAGVNDFPDIKDTLKIANLPKARFFRTGREFEELRLRMENLSERPDVYLAVMGDYAALNGRINFAKNYFELLGLKVIDPGHGSSTPSELQKEIHSRKEKFLVLISTDEKYGELADVSTSASEKFLAGKIEIPGFMNLFAGQNVLEVLSGIVNRWEIK
jgi:hypothetical protein